MSGLPPCHPAAGASGEAWKRLGSSTWFSGLPAVSAPPLALPASPVSGRQSRADLPCGFAFDKWLLRAYHLIYSPDRKPEGTVNSTRNEIILHTELPGVEKYGSGKVRDV